MALRAGLCTKVGGRPPWGITRGWAAGQAEKGREGTREWGVGAGVSPRGPRGAAPGRHGRSRVSSILRLAAGAGAAAECSCPDWCW